MLRCISADSRSHTQRSSESAAETQRNWQHGAAPANPDPYAANVTASGGDRAPHEPSGARCAAGVRAERVGHLARPPAGAPAAPADTHPFRTPPRRPARAPCAPASPIYTTLVVEEGIFRSRLRRPRDLLGAVLAIVTPHWSCSWRSPPSRR